MTLVFLGACHTININEESILLCWCYLCLYAQLLYAYLFCLLLMESYFPSLP